MRVRLEIGFGRIVIVQQGFGTVETKERKTFETENSVGKMEALWDVRIPYIVYNVNLAGFIVISHRNINFLNGRELT